MIQVSDKLCIEFEAGTWVVSGARIDTATFSRLAHACKYVVDEWAGEAAMLHECASMIEVIEHISDRLHDTVARVGQERVRTKTVEITKDMLNEGICEFSGFDPDRDRSSDMIARVYCAMRAAEPKYGRPGQ